MTEYISLGQSPHAYSHIMRHGRLGGGGKGVKGCFWTRGDRNGTILIKNTLVWSKWFKTRIEKYRMCRLWNMRTLFFAHAHMRHGRLGGGGKGVKGCIWTRGDRNSTLLIKKSFSMVQMDQNQNRKVLNVQILKYAYPLFGPRSYETRASGGSWEGCEGMFLDQRGSKRYSFDQKII